MLFTAPPLSLDVPPPNGYEIVEAPVRPQPAPANLRKLSQIPGVTVTYLDAVGADIHKLHDWLTTHGPRDKLTHKVMPATSSWSIGSAVRFTKTGGQCTLTGVTLKFTATAQLPRLAPGQKLPVAVLTNWNRYAAALEDRQAARLGFVHDRLGEVKGAIMRSSCGDWQKVAAASIDRLSQEQAQAFAADPEVQPKLLEPDEEP